MGRRHMGVAASLLAVLSVAAACAQIVELGPERTLTSGASGAGGEPCAASGAVLWAERHGDGAQQTATVAAADGEGGVFVAGVFEGTLALGGVPLVSAQGLDIFVARFDGEGNHRWSQRVGDWGGRGSVALDTTPDGGVVLAGSIDTAGGIDVQVMRFDATGSAQWARVLGGAGVQEAGSVAISPNGAVLVAGTFSAELDASGALHASAGGNDAFLVELSEGGEWLSSQSFGGSGDEYGHAVASDARGRIAFGGATQSAIDLGQGPLTPRQGDEAFTALYDESLAAVWARLYGGPGEQSVHRIAIDASSGDLYVAGALLGSTTAFGQEEIATDDGSFVARLSGADGSGIAGMAMAKLRPPLALVIDPRGDVLLGGGFFELTEIAHSGRLESAGGQDGLIAKLSPLLEPHWVRAVGGAADDSVPGLAVDAQSHVFAAGYFDGSVTLDGCPPITLASAGRQDVLLIELSP